MEHVPIDGLGDVTSYKGWRKLRKYHETGHLAILDPTSKIFFDTQTFVSDIIPDDTPEQLPSGHRPAGAADDRKPG